MDEKDIQVGTACMNKLKEVMKEFGCILDVCVTFSLIHGTSYQITAVPQKNIVLANQMPKIKIGDN